MATCGNLHEAERFPGGQVHLIYRARHFIPAPLEVIEPLWLRFSQLGDAFDPPPGSWDETETAPDGDVLRTIHRPHPRWTYHCTARLAEPRALSLDVQIRTGRALVAHLESRERIFATGFETAWDVEWDGEPGPGLAKLAWGRVAKRLTRELAAEGEHRYHCMCEEAIKSPWARALEAKSEAALEGR